MANHANLLLQTLIEEFEIWRFEEYPEYATKADCHLYNDRLETLTMAKFEDRKVKCESMLIRLYSIEKERLHNVEIANFDLLEDYLKTYIDGYKWRYHSACNPVNFLENVIVNFKSVLIGATPFNDAKDFDNYIHRLECIPIQISEQIGLMKEAILHKTTLHLVSVQKVLAQLDELLDEDEDQNMFYNPIKTNIDTLSTVEEKYKWLNLVRKTIQENVIPALRTLKVFLEYQYIPATRQEVGVWSLPEGKEFYKACLRWHLSTDMLPEEVHEKGLREVSRLLKCFQDTMQKVGFKGTLQEFYDHLRNDSSFFHLSKEDLLQEYKDIITEKVNPRLDKLFHKLPTIDCRVSPMPTDGPLGFYNPPSENGSRPGMFQVNLTNPSQIPKFGMQVICLHEVSPGHHLQSCYARQLPIPTFRKKIDYRNIYSAPMLFPVYTAFCEGWAMYAEDLGVEMGIYETPYELVGKLTDEMYRACRLVVDTGIHYFGWNKEKAIEYMSQNCMMTLHKIENEVDRYITWPGQACSYKIGQMKIKELRLLAEKELGPKFNIKGFHDVMLSMSSVPLNVLENHLKQWIKCQKDNTIKEF